MTRVKASTAIDVALIPDRFPDLSRSVCIVVDVLRASSSIVTLLERGAAEVLPAASVEEARRLGAARPDARLCGEAGGLPPEGFDHGNSPVEFMGLRFDDRAAVLATSNGTPALAAVASAPAVLVGSLLNRTAVARAAVALGAAQGLGLTVICAGDLDRRALALEDTLGAGAIVAAARRLSRSLELTDGAQAALGAFRSHRRRLASALASGTHGRHLASLGLAEDIEFCARLDIFSAVPRLERAPDGGLRLLPA
jgi:2-phosphosulfolactate phosphatase